MNSEIRNRITHAAATTVKAAQSAINSAFHTCEEANLKDPEELKFNQRGGAKKGDRPPGARLARQAPETWGDNNYEFGISVETNGPNGHEIITATGHRPGGGPIMLRCRWKRMIGGVVVDVDGSSQSTYHTTVNDIGCSIFVEATPYESEKQKGCRGTAYGEVGPFVLRGDMRRTLENTLTSRGTRLAVTVNGSEGEHMLFLSPDEIKVTQPGNRSVGFSKDWSSKVMSDVPRVDVVGHTGIELASPDKGPIRLNCVSPNQRDLAILSIRTFQALTLYSLSSIVDRSIRSLTSATQDPESATDVLVFSQRVAADLNDVLRSKDKIEKENRRAITEKKALEEDIASTIGAFQAIIAASRDETTATTGGQTSEVFAREMKTRAANIADLENRLREAQEETRHVTNDFEMLKRDYHRQREVVQRQAEMIADLERDRDMASGHLKRTVTEMASMSDHFASANESVRKENDSLRKTLEDYKMQLSITSMRSDGDRLSQTLTDAKDAEIDRLKIQLRDLMCESTAF